MFAMIVAAQPTTSLLSLSAMCSTKLCIATEKDVETEHVKHSGVVGGGGDSGGGGGDDLEVDYSVETLLGQMRSLQHQLDYTELNKLIYTE